VALVSTAKAHLAALSLLDRSLSAMTDDELTTALSALPDDHLEAIDRLAEVGDGERVAAVREAIGHGRINGVMEQIATVIADPCLALCIDELGDKADLPSHDEMQKVLPKLIETHGIGVVRVMLASAVVGEAPASATLIEMLKRDEVIALPKQELRPLVPARATVELTKTEQAERDAVKAARKERKAREQAAARLRREQQAHAKHRS
jgi:hypothetical protein